MNQQTEPVFDDAPDRKQTAQELAKTFAALYGYEPDGVWSAPGRVNIIGEHVDYQAGYCVPMAISHRCFVAAARTPENRIRIRSLQSEEVFEGSAEDINPEKVTGWAAYPAGVLWALQKYISGGEIQGLDLLFDGYVPLGSGLSSSAALECCLVVALNDLLSLELTQLDQVHAAIKAENDFVGANTGGLDQSASILCTDGSALLLDCKDFSTSPVPWNLAEEDLALLIIDTRAEHSLVGGEYAERRSASEAAAAAFGVENLRELENRELPVTNPAALMQLVKETITDETVARRGYHVITEIYRTKEFADRLRQGKLRPQLNEIGALLNASHDSLRDEYEVTCPELDTAVDAARAAGAHGARMTGGGFGGSAIALVEANDVQKVAQAVATAFADKGFKPAQFFVALPSAGAGKDVE